MVGWTLREGCSGIGDSYCVAVLFLVLVFCHGFVRFSTRGMRNLLFSGCDVVAMVYDRSVFSFWLAGDWNFWPDSRCPLEDSSVMMMKRRLSGFFGLFCFGLVWFGLLVCLFVCFIFWVVLLTLSMCCSKKLNGIGPIRFCSIPTLVFPWLVNLPP